MVEKNGLLKQWVSVCLHVCFYVFFPSTWNFKSDFCSDTTCSIVSF